MIEISAMKELNNLSKKRLTHNLTPLQKYTDLWLNFVLNLIHCFITISIISLLFFQSKTKK